jgi:4-oxalmesaconate hydratase
MIIDCHGHYTTEPKGLLDFRKAQVAAIDDVSRRPRLADLQVGDDVIRASVEGAQLRMQRERGTEATIFSPRASGMAHHIGDEAMSRDWAQASNDMIYRVTQLFPRRFIGVCQLPQVPGVAPANCIAELRRCVTELGFVGCNLNPDPSGGNWTSPPLTDPWWFPLYEAMCELDVPAMVHVSAACNPNFHTTGSHYINADTTAFMQLLVSDLFDRFPNLRLVIPHGGGAAPYHWGRYRGLALALKRPPLPELMRDNVFFDTCVYHQAGIDLLVKLVPIDNILFASELLGAVKEIDPETGHHFDDTRRYIDALAISDADKAKIFEGNARRVYPRLAAHI